MYVKFAELPVHDQDRAVYFYTTYMDMSVAKDSSYGSDWRWVELALDGGQTNLLLSRSSTSVRPESPTIAFVVDDVEALYQTLLTANVEIKESPSKAQWNPSEVSLLFFDSEDNLIIATSGIAD